MMKTWTPAEEAERLKVRFEAVENRAEFARRSGVPGGAAMIYQHINNLRPISLEGAIAYARGFGCRLAEISPKQAEEARRAISLLDTPPTALYDSASATYNSAGSRSDYIQLDVYDVRVAAGAGATPIEHPEVVSHLTVLRKWAEENLGSADPKTIKITTCAGDSMHPTIEDGALLFIDISVIQFRGDGIYCFAWNGGLLVKRLVALRDGSIQVTSDNPAGPPAEIIKPSDFDSLTICGRVKRWWSLRKA